MGFTFGFYNSVNHDRVYDATQFSNIFDGILIDGVYANVGEEFKVTPGSGMSVNVGRGRAWFDHTWSLNDSSLLISLPVASASGPRIDAIVLKTDSTQSVRANSIEVVSGEVASTPQKPEMVDTDAIHYHPLAFVTVPQNATSIESSNIENAVGLDHRTPYADVIYSTGYYDYSWADIPDYKLLGLMKMVNRGEINLQSDLGWQPGDVRTVRLNPDEYGFDGELDIDLVLTDPGHYELETPTEDGDHYCKFVVVPNEYTGKTYPLQGGENPSPTYDPYVTKNYIGSWKECGLRRNMHAYYTDRFPDGMRAIMKNFKVITASTYNGSGLDTTIDNMAVFAEKEMYGTRTYSTVAEANALTKLNFFDTTYRMNAWHGWLRSTCSNGDTYALRGWDTGPVALNLANNTRQWMQPFFCI